MEIGLPEPYAGLELADLVLDAADDRRVAGQVVLELDRVEVFGALPGDERLEWVPAKERRRAQSRDESMQETRAALVGAAPELFAKEGLDASLDAICERAGFSRGAFYVHFSDRDALDASSLTKTILAAIRAPARH